MQTPFKSVSDMTVDEFNAYRFRQSEAIREIVIERRKQMGTWGHQRHDYKTWMSIAMEEIGESYQAINSEMFSGKGTDASDLKSELIQSAAVIVAILEQLIEEEEQ